MITIILGAGVNKEINSHIDIGTELIKHIGDRVTDRTTPNGKYLSAALEKFGYAEKVCKEFVYHLDKYASDVPIPSIDEFLYEVASYDEFKENRVQLLEIGRVMICSHVLGWEGLTVEGFLKLEVKSKKKRLSILADFIESQDLFESERLKIITFNYDRILEYFLHLRFGGKITKFTKTNLIHFYGRLGNCEGVDKNYPNEKFIKFGHNNNDFSKIWEIKDQIRLVLDREDDILEQSDPSNLSRNAILTASNSGRVLVCGYGLNSINNSRLRLSDLIDNSRKFIFNVHPGAIKGDFEKRRDDAGAIRAMLVGAHIQYHPVCKKFFQLNLNSADMFLND